MDLEELGDVLSDEFGGCLELTTGEMWPSPVIEDGEMENLDPDGLDPDRWLHVHGGDGREAWRATASFVAQVPGQGS